jgi:hypothetical protein
LSYTLNGNIAERSSFIKQNKSVEYDTFETALKRVLQVSPGELKKRIKAARRPKRKASVSRVSGGSVK